MEKNTCLNKKEGTGQSDFEISRHITETLNFGTECLTRTQQDKLFAARQKALAKMRTKKRWAWAPAVFTDGTMASPWVKSVKWLTIFGFISILSMGGSYWYHVEQQMELGAEVDAQLLAGELPIHAYLDQDFNNLLNETVQKKN